MPTATIAFAGFSTANSSNFFSNGFTPAGGDVLVVGVLVSDTTDTGVGALSDSRGGAYTLLQKMPMNGQATSALYVYVGNSLATAAATTLAWTRVGKNSGAALGVFRIGGLAGAGVALAIMGLFHLF